ncbi:PREDICTED: uncharacterized protein LOC109147640 [Ipomoea nil]|uniref:uncharacterized protein LOC109147640 n=1 Tax=Ipomoea nil TaxID=35883 RepID=UPI0009008FB1|nr:PREDICTED: uncharacterized protein LOC109147640 [Ipomoea nil]
MELNRQATDDALPTLERADRMVERLIERADRMVERLTQRWADIELKEEEEVGFEPVGEDVGVVAEEEEQRWVCVGRFLTTKVVKLEYMRQVMASVWQPVWGMQVTEIQPVLFMFIFYDETDMQRVLDEGPWSFDNSTLVCRQVEAEAVLEQAANFIGSFVKVDGRYPWAPWKTFHRVRVSIPVDKPLKRRMKLFKRDKTSCWVNFRYEPLHNFCFYCGLLGHGYKFCKLARKSGLTADKFPYTADLKVGGGSRGPRQVGEPWLIPLEEKGKGVVGWDERGKGT